MQPTSPLFKEAINLLIDVKFEFEVVRGDWLEADDPRMYMMPENTDRTELPRFLQVQLENVEWIVYDYDTATLINLMDIVNSL
jgi:hypothetical protein